MNKPLTVARQDFLQGIVDLINKSELPAFVILDIFKSCETELNNLAQKQYETDKEQWDKSVMELEKDKKEDTE